MATKHKNLDQKASNSRNAYRSRSEWYDSGKKLRLSCPRADHGPWKLPRKSRNPLDILEQSNAGRIAELIPIRYGRMLQSPFTFYRGAASIMAYDLSKTPQTGEYVQACGDCHLLNFGAFATPERKLIFDINDFDETLPAPWEWDLKRLATSFIVASRSNSFTAAQGRDAAMACLRSYRENMRRYAKMQALDVWYEHIDVMTQLDLIKDKDARERIHGRIKKAKARDIIEDDFPKLVHADRSNPVIRDNPPLIFHPQELNKKEFNDVVESGLRMYRETLPHERRLLIDRYQLKDIAIKVVGVGSVGTLCGIMLMMADKDDPLFLQLKEARRSVLEPYAGKSKYENQGQRVVTGQRVMQSASDLFLGWTEGRKGKHFYIRQLRDMKLKPLVELLTPGAMVEFGTLSGWALSRAHARSGRPVFLSGYLGKGESFDQAVTDFAVAYADQNERDYAELVQAAKTGKIDVYLER